MIIPQRRNLGPPLPEHGGPDEAEGAQAGHASRHTEQREQGFGLKGPLVGPGRSYKEEDAEQYAKNNESHLKNWQIRVAEETCLYSI